MTIIAPERNTRRDMHARAFAALSNLVAVEHLTPAVTWRVETLTGQPMAVTGQMPPTDVRALVRMIAPYAEYLDNTTWDVEQYPSDPYGRGALHLHGTYGGVPIDVWGGLKADELDEAARLVAVAA